MYAGDNLTNVSIAARYGKQPNWVNWLASKHGWPKRGKAWKPGRPHDGGQPSPPKVRRAATAAGRLVRNPLTRPKKRTHGEVILDTRAELEGRERDLYGAVRDDVAYLRRLGWIINREGDGFLVGNTICTATELHAKAERERRLEQPAPAAIARTGRHAVTPSAPGVPVRRKPEPPKPPAGICDRCGGPRSIGSTRLCRACYAPAKPTPVADLPTASGAALCSCGQPKGDVRAPRCRACYLAIKARAAL